MRSGLRRGAAAALLASSLTVLTAVPAALAAGTTTSTADPASLVVEERNDRVVFTLVPTAGENGTAADLSTADDLKATVTDPQGEKYELEVTKDDAAPDTSPSRTLVIALDVSDSMNGDVSATDKNTSRIEAAKKAINSFVGALPAGITVQLVEFGNDARVTASGRDEVLSTVEGVKSDDAHTALYKGVLTSIDALRRSGSQAPWLVLLTDGRSDHDKASRSDTQAALKTDHEKGLLFSPIAFGADADRAALEGLGAAAGNPRVYEAGNVADLTKTFQAQAQAARNVLTASAATPAGLSGQLGTVTFSGVVNGQTMSVTRYYLFKDAVAGSAASAQALPTFTSDPGWVTKPVLIGALAALFAGLVVIVAMSAGLFNVGSGQTEVMRRLSVYTLNPRDPHRMSLTAQNTETVGGSPLRRSAITLLGRLLRGRDLDSGLDARLDAAGLPLRTAEWMLIHIGSTVGVAFVFLLLGRGNPIGAIVGLLVGFVAPWLVLSIMTSRRRNAFLAQLPDTLQALASSLRAGYSLPQAMDAVVQETPAPMSTELSRSLVETRLGVPPEDALDAIADRTASKDFSWIVIAIRIQRQVGGNLAELLNNVAETLRERERLRGQVRALSAEGRLSAWILSLLPVVFTGYLLVARPEYLEPMFHTPIGILLLCGGGVAVVLGALWMSRIVKVEV